MELFANFLQRLATEDSYSNFDLRPSFEGFGLRSSDFAYGAAHFLR
jgi:hypothetical protein